MFWKEVLSTDCLLHKVPCFVIKLKRSIVAKQLDICVQYYESFFIVSCHDNKNAFMQLFFQRLKKNVFKTRNLSTLHQTEDSNSPLVTIRKREKNQSNCKLTEIKIRSHFIRRFWKAHLISSVAVVFREDFLSTFSTFFVMGAVITTGMVITIIYHTVVAGCWKMSEIGGGRLKMSEIVRTEIVFAVGHLLVDRVGAAMRKT